MPTSIGVFCVWKVFEFAGGWTIRWYGHTATTGTRIRSEHTPKTSENVFLLWNSHVPIHLNRQHKWHCLPCTSGEFVMFDLNRWPPQWVDPHKIKITYPYVLSKMTRSAKCHFRQSSLLPSVLICWSRPRTVYQHLRLARRYSTCDCSWDEKIPDFFNSRKLLSLRKKIFDALVIWSEIRWIRLDFWLYWNSRTHTNSTDILHLVTDYRKQIADFLDANNRRELLLITCTFFLLVVVLNGEGKNIRRVVE